MNRLPVDDRPWMHPALSNYECQAATCWQSHPRLKFQPVPQEPAKIHCMYDQLKDKTYPFILDRVREGCPCQVFATCVPLGRYPFTTYPITYPRNRTWKKICPTWGRSLVVTTGIFLVLMSMHNSGFLSLLVITVTRQNKEGDSPKWEHRQQ